jgi:hypothetical protein
MAALFNRFGEGTEVYVEGTEVPETKPLPLGSGARSRLERGLTRPE